MSRAWRVADVNCLFTIDGIAMPVTPISVGPAHGHEFNIVALASTREAAELIVRLVNAEAAIIAALEAASKIEPAAGGCCCDECQAPLDAARELAESALIQVQPAVAEKDR